MNISFKISGLLFIGMMFSCNDFLEEEPKSEIGSGQYFTNPVHARAAVNILYETGVPDFYRSRSGFVGPYMMNGSYLSGLFDNEYKGQEIFVQHTQNLTQTSDNISAELNAVWDRCYQAISYANSAIKYIPDTPGLEDLERKQLLGQAKFFRALNYFHLVRSFGDIPMTTEPYESLDNLYLPRTASGDVYTLIVSDLSSAVDDCDLNEKPFTQNGYRITKDAVRTLLADVYLHQAGFPLKANTFGNAADAARSVIGGGNHELLQNGANPEESAYNKIRTLDDTPEYIYSVEFNTTIKARDLAKFSFPKIAEGWGVFKLTLFTNVFSPTETYVDVYQANDLRIQNKQLFHTSHTYAKDGVTKTETFIRSPYQWYNEEALFGSGVDGNDMPVYRYAELLLIAAEAIAESEGVNNEAAGYLAKVQARATQEKTEAQLTSELSALGKTEFIKEVWAERLRELPFSFRTWTDIQRTRKYPATSPAFPGMVSFVDVVGAVNPFGKQFKERDLLWPISSNEMQRNPSLGTNNPGY
jgi:hypothetical protein